MAQRHPRRPVGHAALAIASAHTYGDGFKNIRPFPNVAAAGKRLWMTEPSFEGKVEDDLHRGLINTKEIHELFTVTEVGAYFYGWLFAAWEKAKPPHSCGRATENSSSPPKCMCWVRSADLSGRVGAAEFTPYRTSATEQLTPLLPVRPVEVRLPLTLPARSITRLVQDTSGSKRPVLKN